MGSISFASLRYLRNATKQILKLDASPSGQLLRLCSTHTTAAASNSAAASSVDQFAEPIHIPLDHHAANFPRPAIEHGEGEGKKPRSAADKFQAPSLFNDEQLSKFINILMTGGRKESARHVVEKTFEEIKKITLKQKLAGDADIETDPLVIFHDAYKNAQPKMTVKMKRKGGKNIPVPHPLKDRRRRFLGMKWLVAAAENRPGTKKPLEKKLSEEILAAYNGEGGAIAKKLEMHKTAEANRAYAHFRWW